MVDGIFGGVHRKANVYVAWAVYDCTTAKESRGAARDVEKVLALVADRDADDAKVGVSLANDGANSSQPPARNTNEVLVLETPIDANVAVSLGRGCGDGLRQWYRRHRATNQHSRRGELFIRLFAVPQKPKKPIARSESRINYSLPVEKLEPAGGQCRARRTSDSNAIWSLASGTPFGLSVAS
jgi:hypothetical protein